MTLSGNLDFVPLDEVLRLLTKAGSNGAVEITGGVVEGRIFVSGNGIGMATTLADHSLRDHLISSGYVTEENLDAIGRGDMSASNLGETGDSFTDLLREMTVESIYQMESHGTEFQVVKDASSPYATGMPFELETVLNDSRDRAQRWIEVSKVVQDLDAAMHINRNLDQSVVELDSEAWRLISEIGSGSSVRQLASRLGTTDFAIARVAADLKTRGLLVTQTGTQPVVSPVTDDFNFDAVAEAMVPAAEETHAVADPQKSWWEEPEDESASHEADNAEVAVTDETAEADAAVKEAFVSSVDEDETESFPVEESVGASDEPILQREVVGALDSNESEDADAFLEKVFSELGPEQDDESEGHGLMRRRRMGSILRELGED